MIGNESAETVEPPGSVRGKESAGASETTGRVIGKECVAVLFPGRVGGNGSDVVCSKLNNEEVFLGPVKLKGSRPKSGILAKAPWVGV